MRGETKKIQGSQHVCKNNRTLQHMLRGESVTQLGQTDLEANQMTSTYPFLFWNTVVVVGTQYNNHHRKKIPTKRHGYKSTLLRDVGPTNRIV